jgi:hypothetical protein
MRLHVGSPELLAYEKTGEANYYMFCVLIKNDGLREATSVLKLFDVLSGVGWRTCGDWSCCDMRTAVFKDSSLPVDLEEVRRGFYDRFYSVRYVLREWFRGTFYSRIFARAALNHILWRVRPVSKPVSTKPQETTRQGA